jgi:hypothetical protein
MLNSISHTQIKLHYVFKYIHSCRFVAIAIYTMRSCYQPSFLACPPRYIAEILLKVALNTTTQTP